MEKRIEIEIGMWEDAPCPICTKLVDVPKAEKLLYQGMLNYYSEHEIEMYLREGGDSYKRNVFMETLCAEEEAVIMACGGFYYEDVMPPAKEQRIYIVSTTNRDGEPYAFTTSEILEMNDEDFMEEAEGQGWVWSSMLSFAEDWNGNCDNLPKPWESEMRII